MSLNERVEMPITRMSPLTKKENTLVLKIAPMDLAKWKAGAMLIQDAMPYLTADEREFLMTGYTAEDWNQIFGGEEE